MSPSRSPNPPPGTSYHALFKSSGDHRELREEESARVQGSGSPEPDKEAKLSHKVRHAMIHAEKLV